MKVVAGMVLGGAVLLSACGREPEAVGDVEVSTLRDVADRFDRAQIEQDGAALERLVADELVFVGGDGAREGKADFIADWVDPATTFSPITVEDRVFLPLGPEAGVVGGEVVLRGTSNGAPFASRIRFSDTFRLIDGEWRAVHIQATSVEEPAAD